MILFLFEVVSEGYSDLELCVEELLVGFVVEKYLVFISFEYFFKIGNDLVNKLIILNFLMWWGCLFNMCGLKCF